MRKAPVLACHFGHLRERPGLRSGCSGQVEKCGTDALHEADAKASIAKMTDVSMKKEATSHLKMSEDAMKRRWVTPARYCWVKPTRPGSPGIHSRRRLKKTACLR